MENKKINDLITYGGDVQTANGKILPNGCNGISFTNTGNDRATILGFIVLDPGDSQDFSNDPGQEIVQVFSVKFAGVGSDPQLTYIQKYLKTPEVADCPPKK